MAIADLISAAIKEMKQQSYNDLYVQSVGYLTRINGIYNKIRFLEESTTTLDELSSIYGQGSVEATNISASDTFQTAYNKVLLDGYHLLTEVGTWINGSKAVQYSVTVTGNIDGVATKVTWNEMPFEQFASMVDFSSGHRLVMKSSNSILSQMQTQLDNNNQNVSKWDSDKMQQYELFKRIARNVGPMIEDKKLTKEIRQMFQSEKQPGKIREFFKWTKQYKRRWRDVNEGNMVEAFMRFSTYDTKLKPAAVFRAMQDTMSNPDPFYKGGDIGNIQVKGDNATVAYHSTILRMLSETQYMLSGVVDVLRSNQLSDSGDIINSNVSANIEASLDRHISQLVSKYLQTFSR